ncbi:MAG: SDR family oxidoreductase [Stenomitos rutilans HA7619-LM2]|jgi:NAD(P)-dependent dehydrogenase (short-subunit alcohol dehydrogenase family)|nr:SDR family oxidoreductase [Stenomitos rutilans HA7619-LM2]
MMKSVVVTGASTGIGWGTVKVLAQKGFHVFGSVRKAEDADRLVAEFGEAVTPLKFDVTDAAAIASAAKEVRERLNGETLFGLVNNAGIAVSGPLMHLPIDQYRFQMEINLISPLVVTQAFLPLLGTDRTLKGASGRIINISSVGGKIGSPFLGAYSASKHGLEGMSESLRRELMLYGIDVIIVGPGPIATPIWDKAAQLDLSIYAQTDYADATKKLGDYAINRGRQGYPPERVGEVIWEALTAAKPRTRYAIVPKPLTNWILPSLLPKRWVDKIIADRFDLKRK